LRIPEDRDATHRGNVHRLCERTAAELLRLRGRRVGVCDRDIRLPVGLERVVGKCHHSRDAGLAPVEDPVAAELGPHLGDGPAEDLCVEALRGVDVGRSELIPDEDAFGALRFTLGLVCADEGSLWVAQNRDASDLAHLERAGRELATRALRLLDRLVHILDADVTEPVRRRCSLHRLAEAAVALSARRDHRVVGLAGLEDLCLPAEQLRVEVLRLLGIGRNLLVPYEFSDRRCGCAHVHDLLVGIAFSLRNFSVLTGKTSAGAGNHRSSDGYEWATAA
jgi:hypothetical protein